MDLAYTFRSSPSLREIKVETQAYAAAVFPLTPSQVHGSDSYLAQAYLPGDGNTTVGCTFHHQ